MLVSTAMKESQGLKWPGIRDQSPRDIIKPAWLKKDVTDVNIMRCVDCKNWESKYRSRKLPIRIEEILQCLRHFLQSWWKKPWRHFQSHPRVSVIEFSIRDKNDFFITIATNYNLAIWLANFSSYCQFSLSNHHQNRSIIRVKNRRGKRRWICMQRVSQRFRSVQCFVREILEEMFYSSMETPCLCPF